MEKENELENAIQKERRQAESRLADERAQVDKQYREKMQKESERRKEQGEHKRQRERELADRKVGGGSEELENHLAKGGQMDIQANNEDRGAKQEKNYKSLEERQIDIDYRHTMYNLKNYLETIQKYEDLKKNVEQLNKINKKLETMKDKRVKEKYETSKQSLENKICYTLQIKKDKPKLWQSKKAVEQSFRNKVQKGLADMGAKAEVAKIKIAEIKAGKNIQTSQQKNNPVRRTTNRAKTIASQTRARVRRR